MSANRWRTAWITGASSGIGRELALLLARRGVQVAASARSADKLGAMAQIEPNIHSFAVDVTEAGEMAATHQQIIDRLGPIDLAVLNAGVWQPTDAVRYRAAVAASSMAVNYTGIANALEPLLPSMVRGGKGHIALMASVSGYCGLPKSAVYAPSKAAVINLAETLRIELQHLGIRVSVVNPGFVDTPMTAINRFPMPFKITAEQAAARILAGLDKGRFEIAFPWQLVGLMKLARMVPYPVFFWGMRTILTRK